MDGVKRGKSQQREIPNVGNPRFGATILNSPPELTRSDHARAATGFLSGLLTPRSPQEKLNHDLRTAVKLRDLSKINRLISKGADPNAPSINGNTAVSHANHGRDQQVIAAVAPRNGPDRGEAKPSLSLPEMIAARWGNQVVCGRPQQNWNLPAVWASTTAPGKFGLYIPGHAHSLVDSLDDADRVFQSYGVNGPARQTASPAVVAPSRPQPWTGRSLNNVPLAPSIVQQPPPVQWGGRVPPQWPAMPRQPAPLAPTVLQQPQPVQWGRPAPQHWPATPLQPAPLAPTVLQQPPPLLWGGPASPPQQLIHLWPRPIDEAVARLGGGNVVFPDVNPIDQQYRGEECGAHFGTKVQYLNSDERQAFKLTVRDGLLCDAQGRPFDTQNAKTAWGEQGKAIYVMDHSGNIYASTKHATGVFHHSSFLSGAPAAAAGEITVVNGVIQYMNRKTGHYKSSKNQLAQCANHLVSQGVRHRFAVDWGNFA
jgi:hypothetical protein